MWKKDEVKPQAVPEKSSAPVNTPAFSSVAPHPVQPASPTPTPVAIAGAPRGGASISQGIRIKGEVTGSEDLYVDGLVDGKLSLANGSLTIGPNGTVKADVTAREVIVRGRIEGKVTGRDKVQLMGTAQVTGEVQTDRLAIEEGALLRGKVEAGKLAAKAAATTASSSAAD
ncbi:MAG: polymer-forming cytoskeletal protein [Acidobacteriota bacterium]|nr:polymer-forming cytoskeletal protein [Acidobacteriota bacterium]